jgi:hypothetical protein
MELSLLVSHFGVGGREESIEPRRKIGGLGKTVTKLFGQTLTKFPLNGKGSVASSQQRVQLRESTPAAPRVLA